MKTEVYRGYEIIDRGLVPVPPLPGFDIKDEHLYTVEPFGTEVGFPGWFEHGRYSSVEEAKRDIDRYHANVIEAEIRKAFPDNADEILRRIGLK